MEDGDAMAGDAGETRLARASSPTTRLAGPAGAPLHPLVASVALGAWVASFAFDLLSFVVDTAWVYARAAQVLIALGVVVGVLAAALGMVDLGGIARGTPAFRTARRHLALMGGALVLYVASYLLRRRSDFAWHDPVDALPFAVSAVALAALGAGAWLGLRLAHTHGVRTLLDPRRRAGFPAPQRRDQAGSSR